MARSSEPRSGPTDVEAAVVHEVTTPLGPARLHLHRPAGPGRTAPAGTLVLGHGAGGGIGAADLVAVTAAAVGIGWRVVLVEQPWRVAGKKVALAPARLDLGWLAALDGLPGRDAPAPAGPPLVVGGRSAGARVACRTARRTGASGVVCLSFPLHPPGRPERSRAEELAGAGVPVLVVQGERDPFGRPDEVSAAAPGVELVAVPGDHGLASGAAQAAAAVAAWFGRLPSDAGTRP
jgi:predicted alpha/beta-hydrolase family hydrolase